MNRLKLVTIFIISLNNPQTLKGQDLLLETIGALSAQGIYLTYTSIGSASDGHVSGVYTDELTSQLLLEYIYLSEAARDQLSLLMTSGTLDSEDLSYVAQLVTGYNYLISEANGYNNYILTGDLKYANEYNIYRERSWDLISEMMGIE